MSKMNNNVKEIINKTISELINEKENLNGDIDDIIYGDMEHLLDNKDLLEINKIKTHINYIYNLIEKLDKEIR